MPQTSTPVTGRLTRRSEFLATRNGERRRGPYFVLEVLDRNAPNEAPRVGYTVSKRQGNAVIRNRIRRRLKEAVRHRAGFAMKPGHDYVVIARRDALAASFDTLAQSLAKRIAQRPAEPRRDNRNR